jgi:hypothetical protein
MFRKLLSVASVALICTNAYVVPVLAHHGEPSSLLNSFCTFSGSLNEWLDISIRRGSEAPELGEVMFDSIRHCPEQGQQVKLAISTSSSKDSRINQSAINSIDASKCREIATNGHTYPTVVAEAIKEHCEQLGVFGISIYGSSSYDCVPIVEQYKPEEVKPEPGSPEYYEWLRQQELLGVTVPEVDANLQDYDESNDYCLSTQETK